jgi:Holliday junction resolvase-like predicted endonuclease
MTIVDEILGFLIEHNTQQKGLKDRNIDLFLYYFGFMEAALPTYEETGKAFGHKKQNAEPIIKSKLSTFKDIEKNLPSLQKFVNIISSLKCIRSSSLISILLTNGLVASIESCNIGGLLRLITELGYEHRLSIFDFNLKPVKRNEYLPTTDLILVDKSIIKEIKKGIAIAKKISGDLLLINRIYFLKQLGEKYEYGQFVCDLITHKKENICFISNNGEMFFHIGGYKNDGLINCLGKIFNVCPTIQIEDLAEAIQKPIRRRQTNEITKILLPISIIKEFICAYSDMVVTGDNMVSFLGEKKELNDVETMANQVLKTSGALKYRELFEILNKNFEPDICYSEMNYSPIFSKYKDGNGNCIISLIGTKKEGYTKTLSFEEVIENIELASQTPEKFRVKSEEAKESGRLGEKFVNQYFEQCKSDGEIYQFKWVSKNRPGAPCDFVIQHSDGLVFLVDVKSTNNDFNSMVHISYNELCKMREIEQYYIYRVHHLKDKKARRINISASMRIFASTILNWLESAPHELIPDSISILPSVLDWDKELNFRWDDI